jgi:hypothetical protein
MVDPFWSGFPPIGNVDMGGLEDKEVDFRPTLSAVEKIP